jgi:hypothetical protein
MAVYKCEACGMSIGTMASTISEPSNAPMLASVRVGSSRLSVKLA